MLRLSLAENCFFEETRVCWHLRHLHQPARQPHGTDRPIRPGRAFLLEYERSYGSARRHEPSVMDKTARKAEERMRRPGSMARGGK